MAKITSTTTAEKGMVRKTHEGGLGFAREPKAELYVACVSGLNEPTFYESAEDRHKRLVDLVRTVTDEDPEWMLRFVEWLRGTANIRTVSVLVACEAVKARLDAGKTGLNRRFVSAVCQRPDEPGQVIAYWQSRYGRNLPMPLKRGLADAATRLFTERSALRYDGGASEIRLGDVIEMVHPTPKGPEQSALFGWLLDRRHKRRETPAADLDVLRSVSARVRLSALPVAERHAFARQVLAAEPHAEAEWIAALAGQWEWGKSWLGQDSEDTTFDRLSEAEQWELMAPFMGVMALLRNLRNLDEAKVSTDTQLNVKAVLSSEDEVKRSRMFPFRWFSAYKATQGNHWSEALGKGLQHSMANVPSGRTLILVDTSGSMYSRVSAHSQVQWWEMAALFGTALALRAEGADLVQFGTNSARVVVDPTVSVLEHLRRFHSLGGTYTHEAVQTWFDPAKHTRVVIVTDEQYSGGYRVRRETVGDLIPDDVPLFVWNLAGYSPAQGEAGPHRHTLGGLTDASFGLIPLLEGADLAEFPF
jgi:TROVE domain